MANKNVLSPERMLGETLNTYYNRMRNRNIQCNENNKQVSQLAYIPRAAHLTSRTWYYLSFSNTVPLPPP